MNWDEILRDVIGGMPCDGVEDKVPGECDSDCANCVTGRRIMDELQDRMDAVVRQMIDVMHDIDFTKDEDEIDFV